ncbi:jg11952 [Pararge aegeria aegeria]|uniref:Jg11952 protein n=1 Tax=Pararge aegeria aegeria TaxID=348720 RepID=A0A8S4SHD4_9NEOP|nr:jg11952 [Pararge aegeria aegeria]
MFRLEMKPAFLAPFLKIGADGANSKVREAMGVQYISWNYDQMGIVATLHLAEESENTTAWQRFLPTGPVALLPLDSKRSSLVWSMTKAQSKELLSLPEESFVDALNDALWKEYPRSSAVDACVSWVGSVLKQVGLPDGAQRQLPPSVRAIAPGSRAAFPLGFGHSTKYVAPGVALIGDAAHRVHPLAGQGVNLGFGDIKDLTQFLSDALYTGLDLKIVNVPRNDLNIVEDGLSVFNLNGRTAASSAEQAKRRKYENLDSSFIFVPFGVETLGPWGPEARAFFKEL